MKPFNSATACFRLLPLITLWLSTSLLAKEVMVETPEQNYLHGMTKLVQSQWPQVSRIWPNMDYTKTNLLIISINHKDNIPKLWLINVNGLRQVSANETGTIPQPSVENYAIAKVLGRNGVIITIDSKMLPSSPEGVFRLATHELVHGWYQTEIKEDTIANNRNTQYPLDYRPRLYRFMIIRSLQQAVFEPQPSFHLCYAKHWFNKWRSEYNNEYLNIKNTDIAEGSASYIENMTMVIEKDKDLRQVQNKLLQILNTSPDQNSSLDGESYQLGDVAGVVLDTYQPQWKKTFYQDNIPPAERLLNKVTGCNIHAATSPFEVIFQKKTEQMNKQLSTDFRALTDIIRNPQVPFLRLNTQNEQGSIHTRGFYRFNGHNIILALTVGYKGKKWEVQVNERNVFDDGSSILVPLAASTTLKDGTLTLNEPGLKGQIKVKTERDSNNRIIYTPDEM